MCGIFAYLNYQTPKTRKEIAGYLTRGLQRLEYLSYDSAGIALDTPDSNYIIIIKDTWKVKALENAIMIKADTIELDKSHNIHVGIAHTRWATHGGPSPVNAHPHRSDETNSFVLVHNGTITNYRDVKQFLMKQGHEFKSDTDSEVIAKLIGHIYDNEKTLSFRKLVEKVILLLEGAFAICMKSRHFPGECVATRRGSPLLVGIKSKTKLVADFIPIVYNPPPLTTADSTTPELGPLSEDKPIEYFFASDASAIIEHTNRVLYLEDDDLVAVKDGILSIHRLERDIDDPCAREITTLREEIQQTMKGNFSFFRQKEIYEQPVSIANTMRGRVDFEHNTVVLGGLRDSIAEIRRCKRLILIGCGTSYNSAMATRQLLEELTKLPVMVSLSSDFLDRSTAVFRDDVCFFISQSGETADTLMALRYCKSRGALVVGVTNTVGSSICRESFSGIHINAGPEIGVASTKAYTSQFIALVMFALMVSEDRISTKARRYEIIQGLKNLPEQIKLVLQQDEKVRTIAKELYDKTSLLLMGRGYNYATCLEGAMKITELTCIHSEGILAGELKHGPLALIDKEMPVIMIAMRDLVHSKCINALQQVTAREGRPIIVCETGDAETQAFGSSFIEIPRTVDCLQGILTVIPMQLLAYHIYRRY